MKETHNPSLKPYAQKLRKDMTPEERRLWYTFLKHLPVTVNRQKVIGPIIVDFFCNEARVVIEVDGGQHQTEEGSETDFHRDRYLANLGYTVLRYSNESIRLNFCEVCKDIEQQIHLALHKT